MAAKREAVLALCKKHKLKLEIVPRNGYTWKVVDEKLKLKRYCRNLTQCEEAIQLILEKREELETIGV